MTALQHIILGWLAVGASFVLGWGFCVLFTASRKTRREGRAAEAERLAEKKRISARKARVGGDGVGTDVLTQHHPGGAGERGDTSLAPQHDSSAGVPRESGSAGTPGSNPAPPRGSGTRGGTYWRPEPRNTRRRMT
jgi:hypothetical protein